MLRTEAIPGLRSVLTVPLPGSTSRYVFAMPQPEGLIYLGLTDEPVDGPVPDVPEPTESEIGFLLDVVGSRPGSGRCVAVMSWVRTPGSGRCSKRTVRPRTSRASTRCSPRRQV